MEERSPASQINALYPRAVEGDAAAEERLFAALRVRFLYITNQRIWDRAAVEDIVQVALAAVHREYRAVAVESSFAAWAQRVLDNRILGHLRKAGRRERILGENRDEAGRSVHAASDPGPDLRRRLLGCLRRLGRWNVKYARALNLSHQGYGTGEICERLGIVPNYLYVLLSRARSMLRACLETGRVR